MSQTTSTAAKFTVPFTRFLDKDGKPLGKLPAFCKDTALLEDIYRKMVLIRTFDAKAVALQRTGRMSTFPCSLGQEAVGITVGKAMQQDDVLMPYYRCQGIQFQRGVTLAEILLYWGGDERGLDYRNNKQDFPICVPIATQYLHAAGAAKAIQLRKEKRVVVTAGGDGSTSQGDFYEAMNLAGAWNLPVVFIIENNQWAISVPRGEQSNCETLAQKAIAGGFAGEQVDGNDPIAMYYAVEKAISKARKGEGPHLIEAMTYRLHDHTTADDASRYREQSEVDSAWDECPVKRFKAYMMAEHDWNDTKQKALEETCAEEVAKAVEEYLNIDPQPISAIFDYHYETWPDVLAEQREEAIALGAVEEEASHG